MLKKIYRLLQKEDFRKKILSERFGGEPSGVSTGAYSKIVRLSFLSMET
jgi:hypothetical protein